MSFSRSKVARFNDNPADSKTGSTCNLSKQKFGLKSKEQRGVGYKTTGYSQNTTPRIIKPKTEESRRSTSLSSDNTEATNHSPGSCPRSRSCGDEKKMIGVEVTTTDEEASKSVAPCKEVVIQTSSIPTTVTVKEPSMSEMVTKQATDTDSLCGVEGLPTVDEDMGILSGQEIDSRLRDDESTAEDDRKIMDSLMSISDGKDKFLTRKKSNTSSQKSTSGIPIKRTINSPKSRSPCTAPSSKSAKNTPNSSISQLTTVKSNPATPRRPTQCRTASTLGPQNKVKIATRQLECQFIAKKKRFMQLKKEMLEKQHPVVELYKQLVDLKNQVRDKSGKELALDDMSVVECGDQQIRITLKSESTKPLTSNQDNAETTIGDANLEIYLKSTREIPLQCLEFYKAILDKRSEVLMTLRNYGNMNEEEIQKNLEKFTLESNELENQVEIDINKTKELVENAVKQLHSAGVRGISKEAAESGDHVETLEKRIEELQSLLTASVKESRESTETQTQHIQAKSKEITNLTKRIKDLETELEAQQSINNEVKERACSNDTSVKQMKARVRDAEAKHKDMERKYQEVQKTLRKLQESSKAAEDTLLIKQRELEKQLKIKENMIHKLTTDRVALETRIKTMEALLEDSERLHRDDKADLEGKVDELEHRLEEQLNEKNLLTNRCKTLQKEMANMDTQREMALKLARVDGYDSPGNYDNGFETRKEKELFLNLEATKISLEEATRKVSMYKDEKLRFVDMIGKMAEKQSEKNREKLMQSMVEKEELITRLQQDVAEYREAVEVLQIRTEQFAIKNADLENRLHVRTNEDVRLKNDERLQLDEQLEILTDYKQKNAALECELQRKNYNFKEMERKLQMQENFINMLKEKKDKAISDNEVLQEYAAKIMEQFKIVSNQLVEKNDKLVNAAVRLDKLEESLREAETRIMEQKSNMYQLNDRRFKLQSETEKLQEELQMLRQKVGHSEAYYSRSHSKLFRN